MYFFDLFRASLELGLPLFLCSWLLFTRLYDGGVIGREESGKNAKQQLKAFNKTARKKVKGVKPTAVDRVMTKWSSFGGGFYGLAALWTFIVIELKELAGFVFYFPGLGVLFEDGLVSLIVSIIVNQIANAISALIWFSYWPAQSILIWVAVAYLGYWLGMDLARRGYAISAEAFLATTKRWFT